jgi:hypothetical protein
MVPRRTWSLKEKQLVCAEWDAALSRMDKQRVREKYRADQLDGHTIQKWKKALSVNAESPKGVKAAKRERRLRGAGRKPHLTEEQENQIDDWIVAKRLQLLQVRVNNIQRFARLTFPTCQDGITQFKAGPKWVKGFMDRRNFLFDSPLQTNM